MRGCAAFLFITALIACGGRTPLGEEPLGTGARSGAGSGGIGSGNSGGSSGSGPTGGSGGDGSDTVPPGPDVGPVKGTVHDVEGRAYPGVELRLGSRTAITDAEGHFEFAGAPATYDVIALLYGGGVYVYSGLTRRDPTLRIFDRYSLENRTLYARVTVTTPSPDTDTIKVVAFFELTDAVDFNSYNSDKIDGVTSFYVYWVGSKAVGIRLHAFQLGLDSATRAPTRILGYAREDRRMVDQDSIDWVPAWKDVPFADATIEANATAPAGYTGFDAVLFIRPNDRAPAFRFSEFAQREAHVSFLVPDMPGALFDVEMRASAADASTGRRTRRLTLSSPSPLLEMEPGPISGTPRDGSTGVGAGTKLQWSNPTGRPAYVLVNLNKSIATKYPTYYLVTAGNSIAIPDLSRLNIVFPRGVEGYWKVFSTSATTVDDLAALGNANPDLPQTTYAYSNQSSFTTK